MPVPLLLLRSEGRGQSGQRTVAAPPAGAAVAHCRRTARRRQAVYGTRRLPADVTPKTAEDRHDERDPFLFDRCGGWGCVPIVGWSGPGAAGSAAAPETGYSPAGPADPAELQAGDRRSAQ